MKKSYFLVLSLIVCLLLVSCTFDGDNNKKNTPAANQANQSSTIRSQSPESIALEAYKKVLENIATFINTEDKKPIKLNEFLGPDFEVTRFAVIDMDGDDVPEIIVESTIYNTILHYIDGEVYCYNFVHRGMKSIKTDGTFNFSSGASDSGYGRIRFTTDTYAIEVLGYSESNWENNNQMISFFIDNKSVTEEEFLSFANEQNSKEDVSWFDFNQENMNEHLLSHK